MISRGFGPLTGISIHALREEGDKKDYYYMLNVEPFLSTPSARRATLRGELESIGFLISIHALREEGDQPRKFWMQRPDRISIHALREEGDLSAAHTPKKPRYFYPRPPRGGRLIVLFRSGIDLQISIHALREEGDFWTTCPTSSQ